MGRRSGMLRQVDADREPGWGRHLPVEWVTQQRRPGCNGSTGPAGKLQCMVGSGNCRAALAGQSNARRADEQGLIAEFVAEANADAARWLHDTDELAHGYIVKV